MTRLWYVILVVWIASPCWAIAALSPPVQTDSWDDPDLGSSSRMDSIPSATVRRTEFPVAITLQLMGLTLHPLGSDQPHLYPRKLDEGGQWVGLLGVATAVDVQPWETVGLRAKTAWYRDCADQPQMFFHLGIRGWIVQRTNWGIQGGLGPTLVIRRSWANLPGVRESTFFEPDEWNGWQHGFVWYGGEFDVWRRLSPRWELGVTVIPGFPWAITTLIGLRKTL